MFKKIFWVLLVLISISAFGIYYYKDAIFNNNQASQKVIKLPTIVGAIDLNVTRQEWLSSMVSRLDKKGLTVNQINIGEFADATLRLHTGEIRVNMNDNVDDVWNSYISAIAIEPLKSIMSGPISDFEYLDLRFGNKVFYKLRTVASTSPESVE